MTGTAPAVFVYAPKAAMQPWRCSGCTRVIAKHSELQGTVQIKCRSCGAMNTLTVR